MRKRILQLVSATVLGLSMMSVVAMAQSGSIDTTGPDSDNSIEYNNRHEHEVENNNDIRVRSNVRQDAKTGDAKVYDNTEGGDASTGEAYNDNLLSGEVVVDNTNANSAGAHMPCGCDDEGSIEKTGPDSTNTIEFRNRYNMTLTNNNSIDIQSDVDQDADSGDATVSHNTEGGDASTGDATNVNTTELVIEVMN